MTRTEIQLESNLLMPTSQFRGHGSPWFYLGIYSVLCLIFAILSMARELFGKVYSLKAGRVRESIDRSRQSFT
jgi:hypothetical protein